MPPLKSAVSYKTHALIQFLNIFRRQKLCVYPEKRRKRSVPQGVGLWWAALIPDYGGLSGLPGSWYIPCIFFRLHILGYRQIENLA